jgi:hypothetical protein
VEQFSRRIVDVDGGVENVSSSPFPSIVEQAPDAIIFADRSGTIRTLEQLLSAYSDMRPPKSCGAAWM